MVDVVGVGNACYDTICLIGEYPKENTAIEIENISFQGGGMVSQAIVSLSRLGIQTAFVGTLGNDYFGNFLLDSFISEKVDVSGCSIKNDEISPMSYIFVSQKTKKRTIGFYGTNHEFELNSSQRKKIIESKIMHVDAFQYKLTIEAAKIAKENNVLISLDGCNNNLCERDILELLKYIDILIMDETFYKKYRQIFNESRYSDCINNIGVIISTHGENGCILHYKGEEINFNSYEISSVDTTGAGDVFHGAIIYGLITNMNIKESIKFASAAAAVECLSFGGRVGIPSKKQVEDFMTNNPYIESEIDASYFQNWEMLKSKLNTGYCAT